MKNTLKNTAKNIFFGDLPIWRSSLILNRMAWVIVGLGNPGNEYENTRHNAGRMAVSHFAKKKGAAEWREDKKAIATVAKDGTTALVLPDTFMNKSGSAVVKYVKSPKAAEKLIVVYDDLDLPIGKIKLSFDRGSGGHRGLDSIMRSVKTRAFARIRIGVSPETPSGKLKKPHGEDEVNTFILAKFKPAEMDELKKVFKRVDEAIEAIMEQGALVAMNTFNQG
jgi:PTH1 family peptidyl-tRNA hydrolase